MCVCYMSMYDECMLCLSECNVCLSMCDVCLCVTDDMLN